MEKPAGLVSSVDGLYRKAFYLVIATILINIAEGLISMYYGITDNSLALFGFGLDSFIETISAIGVGFMIKGIWNNQYKEKRKYEAIALKITGWCFYIFSVLLIGSTVYNIIQGRKPSTTIPGIIISCFSILLMILLIFAKRSIGKKLRSDAILEDANCNLVCVYMSIVVLVSSGFYELFRTGIIDILGSAGIIFFSIKEGIESFKRSRVEWRQ